MRNILSYVALRCVALRCVALRCVALRCVVRTFCVSVLASAAFAVSAQDIEEVVVTGSYIKGTPEDAALPVDVITSDDLAKIGSPSIIEMVRNLGVTAANLGETNQFTTSGQANEGAATVNLRGLGAGRTLVLINGRRHVSTELNGIDINAFPISAIGRVEVLKDGAAALYGSDAIGGVVNFITRNNFEGFEVGGNYQNLDSGGDWNISGLFGTSGDKWNWTVAGEYGEREEVGIKDRSWALVNTSENLPGGWSGIGNPGNGLLYYPLGELGTVELTVTPTMGDDPVPMPLTVDIPDTATASQYYVDPQCENLGALRDHNQQCGFRYTFFDNLIEETEEWKVFTTFSYEFNDNHRLQAEFLMSETDLPVWKTSPSYPPQSLFGPDRRLLANHPGLVDFVDYYGQDLPPADSSITGNAAVVTAVKAARGLGEMDDLDVSIALPDGTTAAGLLGGLSPEAIVINRPFGVIGRFGTGEAESKQRLTENMRFAVGLSGNLFDGAVDYDVNFSYSERDRFIGGQDLYVERMGLALKGYGGPNCQLPETMLNDEESYEFVDGDSATPGAGCEYYNPFSRALPGSVLNGATNPDHNPDLANSEELLRWMIGERGWDVINELTVIDVVFSGETTFALAGGNIGYAIGIQGREEYYDSDFWDIADRSINPCPYTEPASVALGLVGADQLSPDCSAQTGVAAFLAASDEETEERTIYAAFGELAVPIRDNIDVQLAVRYEDYGGEVGSSLDPKVAASWRVNDSLTVRGSASTTFRGPPQSVLGGTGTALSFVAATNAFKAIDTIGNPNLEPEAAVSSNLGIIYEDDSFFASLDWWVFSFEDSFQTESFNAIVAAYTANGCIDSSGTPGDTAICNALRGHLFPVAAHTNLAAIERIEINWINGGDIETSGIDLDVRWNREMGPGTLTAGLEASYVLEYERDDLLNINKVKLGDGGDLVGRLNYNQGSAFTSKPELKGNVYARYEMDDHYASLIARYVSSYDDLGAPASHPHLGTIDSHITWDAHYNFTGFEGVRITLSVINLTDEDPPAARGDINYDPFTHNPFGRMIKVGVTYSMGQ